VKNAHNLKFRQLFESNSFVLERITFTQSVLIMSFSPKHWPTPRQCTEIHQYRQTGKPPRLHNPIRIVNHVQLSLKKITVIKQETETVHSEDCKADVDLKPVAIYLM